MFFLNRCKEIMMKRFKKAYIEITNVCNLSCDFCPKTKRHLTYSGSQDFETILKAVKPYTDYIYLHLMGEPTLHPELETFLELSSREGLKVNLTTNGTLLRKVEPILLGAKALRQVNISLHSFESNTQEADVNAYLDEVISFVLKAIESTKIICSIRLWNMDDEDLKGKNQLNDLILNRLEQDLQSEVPIKEALKQKQGIKLRNQVYLNMAKKFEWPDRDKETLEEEVFCYGLRDQIGVLVDGTVVPCCLDSEGSINLGNIFETPLETILESPRAKALYEGFSNRRAVEELCKKCGYANRYHSNK